VLWPAQQSTHRFEQRFKLKQRDERFKPLPKFKSFPPKFWLKPLKLQLAQHRRSVQAVAIAVLALGSTLARRPTCGAVLARLCPAVRIAASAHVSATVQLSHCISHGISQDKNGSQIPFFIKTILEYDLIWFIKIDLFLQGISIL
jgi:hypothetical protein